MTKNWTEKFSTAILAVSQADLDSAQAMREWHFSGSITDHGKPTARCGICGHHGLRYHFRIVNQITGEALWVGSQCVLNFEIATALDTKNPSSRAKQSKNILKHEIDAEEITNLIIPLKELYDLVEKGDRRKIHWSVGKYQRRGGFSPKDLAWLFQAMKILGINYQPQDYPLMLRNKQDLLEFSQLTITARTMIEPSMTEGQRRKIKPRN